MSVEEPGGVERFEPGDVVRVRREPMLSVVEAPWHRACELPEDPPDLGEICCVPVTLVRTPADDENGVLRWVEPRYLARVEPDSGDNRLLPGDVPVGSFIFDDAAGVWVEATAEPVTVGEVTAIPAIEGFDVPVLFDASTPITVCHGLTD